MIDPRLNDRGYSEYYRAWLANRAGLIAADHPQLWTDSDLHMAAARATARDARRDQDREPQGETVRLFEPAPNQIPGQTRMATSYGAQHGLPREAGEDHYGLS